ncbi:uncharacterized protein LOC113773215 [Coffea eugenioides]|uniref:Uncharacterized protein n=1 Tax=Coffea arabica TaxID=13443 RepID=A0ABM4UWF7_COFAR|nr:uncharacterized protein LOC113773215 [Coffea eugenioides]
MQGMASSIAWIAVFSIALFACITEARKNPTDFLQSAVINEHTEDNHHAESTLSNQKKTTNGNTLKDFEYHGTDAKSKEGKLLMKDFESKPGSILFLYHGNDAKSKEEKPLMKDFESKPGSILFLYHGNDAKSKEEKPLMKDFESKPGSILLLYHGNDAKSKEEKPLIKDFESKPDPSKDVKSEEEKPLVKDN